MRELTYLDYLVPPQDLTLEIPLDNSQAVVVLARTVEIGSVLTATLTGPDGDVDVDADARLVVGEGVRLTFRTPVDGLYGITLTLDGVVERFYVPILGRTFTYYNNQVESMDCCSQELDKSLRTVAVLTRGAYACAGQGDYLSAQRILDLLSPLTACPDGL